MKYHVTLSPAKPTSPTKVDDNENHPKEQEEAEFKRTIINMIKETIKHTDSSNNSKRIEVNL